MSPYSSVDSPLSAYRAEIVRKCATAVQDGIKNYTASRVLLFDDCVVKFNYGYGGGGGILNEGDTQAAVYTAFKDSPHAPRVPEVYDCFSFDYIQYLVMECVNLPTVESWINAVTDEAETQPHFDVACEAVANALRWLFTLSPPVGAEIGLIEGEYTRTQSDCACADSGCARHRFFGYDSTAPFRYTGAAALQRHINKVLSKYRPATAAPLAVETSDEPLVMVQADITPCNFLIDPETLRVTLIDFGCVSALPRSFVSFTLGYRDKFVMGIAKVLDWQRSDNYSAMVAAAGLYPMLASPDVGLDKDGFPVSKVKS